MRFKMERFNFAQSWEKTKPKTPPRRHETSQDAPRDALRRPKTLPSCPSDDPKRPPRPPRCPAGTRFAASQDVQDAPKMAQDASKTPQEVPDLDFGRIFGKIPPKLGCILYKCKPQINKQTKFALMSIQRELQTHLM